ncbi:hypothetical protein [Streptomyces sp. NPDC060022]|uniref:hypothetical protein n=1 Tax=Streptomyces sp. NPDC060022 TaxID=3347039 RepID=UPI0036CC0174
MNGSRLRFEGWIAGVGTSSGTRVLPGRWTRSPFESFSDVMVERADGERLLLAPRGEIGTFVADTYGFDAVRVQPVTVNAQGDTWAVEAGTTMPSAPHWSPLLEAQGVGTGTPVRCSAWCWSGAASAV